MTRQQCIVHCPCLAICRGRTIGHGIKTIVRMGKKLWIARLDDLWLPSLGKPHATTNMSLRQCMHVGRSKHGKGPPPPELAIIAKSCWRRGEPLASTMDRSSERKAQCGTCGQTSLISLASVIAFQCRLNEQDKKWKLKNDTLGSTSVKRAILACRPPNRSASVKTALSSIHGAQGRPYRMLRYAVGIYHFIQ